MARSRIRLASDPMWIATGCSECGEMIHIRLRSDAGVFEEYACSCERMWREVAALQWEMWWDSDEGQRHAAVLSSITDERRSRSERGWS